VGSQRILASRCLVCPSSVPARVIAEHWEADPRNVEIIPQFLVRDPLIEALVRQLMVEGRLLDGFMPRALASFWRIN
jgi:hypothetical protein